jgi:outer membrane protein TolC
MAAANAQIGIAETAFFPTVTLSADYGVSASMLKRLFNTASRMWSVGSTLTETLFDAGLRHAQVEQQRAAFDATIADYRQTVLTGFQQVEDQLAAQRILTDQAAAEEAAVASAREAERIIFNQYKAGTVAYTSVIVAQTTALNDAVTAANIRQNRLVASVALIQALGGGWDASQVPDRERIDADQPLNFNPLPPPDAAPRPVFLDWLPKLW